MTSPNAAAAAAAVAEAAAVQMTAALPVNVIMLPAKRQS